MGNAIEVSGLTRHYPGFALEDVSFTLPEGSIMGLIGENGAGKTTTIRLLLNAIRREAGEVRLLGMDVLAEEQAVKRQLGVVLDESFFHDVLKPGEVGKILAGIHPDWDGPLYKNLLRRFELPEGKTVKSFSRGMKMKLNIAAALAHHPRLLILDEATSGLDPVVRDEMLDLFLEFIQDERCAVLISSHITSDLEKISDYITFIHKGRVALSMARADMEDAIRVVRLEPEALGRLPKERLLGVRRGAYGCEALVRDVRGLDSEPATLDQIMVLYGRGLGA